MTDIQSEIDSLPALERRNTIWFILGTIVTILIVLVSGVTVWVNSTSKTDTVAESKPISALVVTPTSVPLSKSDITLEVWNGSGVVGAAGKKADQLQKLGYTIMGC